METDLKKLTDQQVTETINRERNAGNIEAMELAFAESYRRRLWEKPRKRRLQGRCPTCGRPR